MATIKYVKTPDGTTHNIGGGGTVVTYSISLGAVSSNTVPIILTGSNGTTDTVYVKGGGDATMSVSGDTMTITATSGQTITYTLSGSGTTTTYTITNTPSSGTASSVTIPAATTSSAGLMTDADKTKLDGIASGAEVNVQSDWNQTDSTADDYIKNKPTIPPGVTVDSALSTTSTNPVENRVITNALDNKVDKETGKGLSTNDFTTAEKNKLAGIQAGAEQNVQSDWNEADSTSDAYILNKPSIPTKTSDLTNDSNFVSDASYVHTDNNFTTTLKNKLNGIESGAEVNVQSDWSQSDSTADDYIKNKPTIPTKTSDLTNDSDFVSDASYVHTDNNFTTTLKNKLDGIQSGAEVNVQADWTEADSTSDAYIKNKPSIPSVGDGTLTIQKNGSTIDTFTANQSSNTTVNVTVPTATSDLTNDSNFVSDASYVHTDNNFTTTLKNKLDGIASGAEVNVQSDWNEADSTSDAFIKNKPSIPTKTSDLTNDSNFVSDASYVHTDNNFTNSDVTKLSGIESGAEVNVQADWDQSDSTADDYIKNKPIIPPGSTVDPALDPTSSNAVANSAIVAALDTKVDKVTGKGLSEEDFTSTEKTKLSGIADGAEVNVQSDWDQTDTTADDYIKNKPTIPTISHATRATLTRGSSMSSGLGSLVYDSNTGMVVVNFSCVKSSNISTSEVLFNVPSAYRPSSAQTGSCMVLLSSGGSAGQCNLATNGNITQAVTGSGRSVFGSILYVK